MRGKMKWLFGPGLFLLLSSLASPGQPAEAASMELRGKALVGELGCTSCHTELRLDTGLRERTPDLGSAGLRYRPAWLFEFLQRPVKVRQHLGHARMPDFHLTEKEAVALVAFLQTQRKTSGQWPPLPEAIASQLKSQPQPVTRGQLQAELSRGLLCLTCHKLDGQGGNIGIELSSVGYRLQPDWVRQYLVAPAMFGVSPITMPPQFYQLATDRGSFRELGPGAAERIRVITDHLASLNTPRREALEQAYHRAIAVSPEANAIVGEKLFTALNCAACHRHESIPPRLQHAAPDLTREGLRVNKPWLEAYVKNPQPIRPFGFRPGDGSRMPDFQLSDEEAAAISGFLAAQKEGAEGFVTEFLPQALSAFAQSKAKRLLTDKLSCLGCHQLGDQGGRIGPNLSSASARLKPAYVYRIIENPRAVAPHSIMPRVPLAEETIRLVASYLLQQEHRSSPAKYLSAIEHDLIPLDQRPPGGPKIRQSYLSHCAACHGPDGQGNGYNARFLPVKPTAHANAAYLATRPDDTLYDGIHAGGYILNRSHLMPPWGETLPPREIQELIGFLRTLCQCQGPAWSLDGTKIP